MTTTNHTATLAAFFGPEHWPPATVTEICTLTAWALGGPEWPAASVTISGKACMIAEMSASAICRNASR